MLTKKLDIASSKYQSSLDFLALYIDIESYPVSKTQLARIMYPALSALPTETDLNEKLARVGRIFLELQCQAFMLHLPSRNTAQMVNGYDFSRFEDGSSDALHNQTHLIRYLKANGLHESIILDFNAHEHTRDEQAVSAFYRIIGTLIVSHGAEKTSGFVNDRVIGGINGLMRLRVDR